MFVLNFVKPCIFFFRKKRRNNFSFYISSGGGGVDPIKSHLKIPKETQEETRTRATTS